MQLKDILDIIVITWNRKSYLEKTLNYIFSEDSPIKNCDITVLDNCSTDGTSKLIEDFRKYHQNLKHIVNKYNIGGNANICRAFEIPTKKYFWILCDDDDFDWSNWEEIENALFQDYDAVMLEWKQEIPKQKNEGYILNNMAFLPSTIYKTKNLNDDIMYNAYVNILYSLPHLALGIYLINENKKIYIASKKIIDAGVNIHASVKTNENIHGRARHFSLFNSFISSYQMIKDKNIRERCCDCLCQGHSLFYSFLHFLTEGDFYLYNIFDIIIGLSWRQRIILLLAILSYLIVYFDRTNRGVRIHLFGNVFKTYILYSNENK